MEKVTSDMKRNRVFDTGRGRDVDRAEVRKGRTHVGKDVNSLPSLPRPVQKFQNFSRIFLQAGRLL